MNNVINDIWPILLTALIGVILGYARYVHNLKERVSVLENTIKSILTTIDSIHKRQDSHSKKQDDVLDRIGVFEREALKQMSTIEAKFSGLESDVKSISRLLSVSDMGIKIIKQ